MFEKIAELRFSWFSSVPSGERRGGFLKLGDDHFPQILSNSSFMYHPFIRRCMVLVTEKASLNKATH
jgi:hypothetical protein